MVAIFLNPHRLSAPIRGETAQGGSRQQDRAQTWVWYASGIVLGAAILALFALFEKRRNDVVGVVERIRRWD